MLYAMEVYDIAFFRLCAALPLEFLSPLYPGSKAWSARMFGYNKRTHLIHFAIYLPPAPPQPPSAPCCPREDWSEPLKLGKNCTHVLGK